MTPTNVKRRERSESEVVQKEFYNQSEEVKFSKIEKYTLPQKSFVLSTVKFIFDNKLP